VTRPTGPWRGVSPSPTRRTWMRRPRGLPTMLPSSGLGEPGPR
jgi:hypothetical protein